MKKHFLILFLLCSLPLSAQIHILQNSEILKKTEQCLYATYANNIQEAQILQAEIQKELPQHPVSYFLDVLLIYWENYPLLPDAAEVEHFENAVRTTVELSEKMLKNDPEDLEGIFFDMHARAFRAMYWADNGKPGKVIKDLDNMYRLTIRGITKKNEFEEFYFSSGLYNYYIEAYVESHPVYKPVAVLFRKGNKEQGLKELEHACKNTSFLKFESMKFMSLIQLLYEENKAAALEYSSRLYNNFPNNKHFLSQYLITLLYNEQYTVAEVLTYRMKENESDYCQMTYHMTKGFIAENRSKDNRLAREHYNECLKYCKKLGNIAFYHAAISESGLYRIEKKAGNLKSAKSHRNAAKKHANFEILLEF